MPRHASHLRPVGDGELADPPSTDPPDPSPCGAERLPRGELALALLLGALAARLYYATGPAVVNLDGLGYIKLLPHNFAAGHLLYMPLLRALTALCRGHGLVAGRLLSAGAAGASITLAYVCARGLASRLAATVTAAGLSVSYAVWIQGGDVEAYSCGLAALLGVLALALAYRRAPTTLSALNLGLALGGAVLFHMTHVIATPFVVVWAIAHAPSRRRGLRDATLAAATGGAVSVAAYAYATFHVRHTHLKGAIAWVATAGHGFRYDGSLLARLADCLYGLAKAFVWSPYLYESNAQRLLAQFILGLAPLGAVALLVVVRRRAIAAALPWRSLCAWMVPYAAMALAFFGSDHERWLFILPPLWLVTGVALASLGARSGARWAAALVAYLAVANAATAVGPARHECWDRTRADAAARLMSDGDLVIFPGHSWDEYIGFYTHTKVVPFPLAYYAGRDGHQPMIDRLGKEIALARKRRSRVWAVRIFGSDGDDPGGDDRGYYELGTLGFRREDVRALLAKMRAVPCATVEPKVTVWRLDDGG